jgi:hypothetical protein
MKKLIIVVSLLAFTSCKQPKFVIIDANGDSFYTDSYTEVENRCIIFIDETEHHKMKMCGCYVIEQITK